MPIVTPGLSWRLPQPVLPKEIDTAPQGEDWIYEFLWGGERVRAIKGDGGVCLMTRDGRNLSNRFPVVAAAVAKLHCASAVIDGEILLLDRCSPRAVRFLSELSDDPCDVKVVLIAYDLLKRCGEDLRHYPASRSPTAACFRGARHPPCVVAAVPRRLPSGFKQRGEIGHCRSGGQARRFDVPAQCLTASLGESDPASGEAQRMRGTVV